MFTLKQTNTIACIFHILCFVSVLVLYLVYKKSRNSVKIDVFRNTLAGPIQNSQIPPISPNTLSYCSTGTPNNSNPGQCNIVGSFQQPKKVTTINVAVYCMIFFALTALFHGLYAWNGFIPYLSNTTDGFYSTVINDGWNPYRWIEYSISASIMSIILGVVQGTGDYVSILFMAGVTGAMQFFGFCVESVMRKSTVANLGYIQKDIIVGSSFGGWLLFAFLWVANLYCFTTIISDTRNKFKNIIDPNTKKNVRVLPFVYFLIIFKILGYASFGFIQLYQIYKNWNIKDFNSLTNFETIENLYLLLSFISKFGLAGGVSYGLILQTRNCP